MLRNPDSLFVRNSRPERGEVSPRVVLKLSVTILKLFGSIDKFD